MIANQKDRESEREVGNDKAEKFKQIKELDYFAETSAKTGDNVKETFTAIGKMLYQKNIEKILNKKKKRGAGGSLKP